MKILIITLLIFALILSIDFYTFKAIKLSFNAVFFNKILFKILYWSIPTILILVFLTGLYKMNISSNEYSFYIFYLFITLFILFYIPKINISVFHIFEDIISLFTNRYSIISKIGMSISAIIFLFILHGIIFNKYNYKIQKQEIFFDNLPSNFDGYKIIQISDIHLGSMLKNTKGINKAVEIINSENPDLIVLTGDLVNNTANEVDGFENTFLKLKAKDGKLSILGNHDYGDYFPWKNTSDKNNNLIQLKNKHSQIGFKLLLNSNISIQKNVDSIIIAGVENWGKPPFSQFGNLTKALQNTSSNNFVILLSHDPSHWKEKITDKTNIELTLSGHTHAMQAGIKFGNFQWSPVSLKYKEWGGLYKHKKQYLYVNKGLGFIGLLGRIGIRPEITKIILRKTK